MNPRLMSIDEFMKNPLIDYALKINDKSYFMFILKDDIFNGLENLYSDYKKLSPVLDGSFCKLYYECKNCKVTKRYSEYANIEKLRTKGRRICRQCNYEKSLKRKAEMIKINDDKN